MMSEPIQKFRVPGSISVGLTAEVMTQAMDRSVGKSAFAFHARKLILKRRDDLELEGLQYAAIAETTAMLTVKHEAIGASRQL